MNGVAGHAAPLIVTALLPKGLHGWATELRTRHFPPERNYLEAHVTLFHAIPAQFEAELVGVLKRFAVEFTPVDAQLLGLMSLGRGTALRLESPGILRLRDGIADHLRGLLTAQDQHRPRLHVTIQNKVPPAEAKALQSSLEGTIEPLRFAFRGLGLYRYMGGPWQHIRDFAFRGREKA